VGAADSYLSRLLASVGCVLSACTVAKPSAAPGPSRPGVIAQGRTLPDAAARCASRIDRAPAQPLGAEWEDWLAWGRHLELPSIPATDPTEVFIGDIREHVVLARHGKARFEANGPVFADAGGTPFMFPVFALEVDTELARIRIVSEFEGSEIFVWVDQLDLLPVPVAQVQLSGVASSVGSARSGVWLAPGHVTLPVAIGATEIRVVEAMAGLRVEGTLSTERLGYLFSYDHFEPAMGEDVRLLPGEILAVPGGDPIAIGDPEREAKHIDGEVRILDAQGPWRLVEVVSRDFAVRGYVPAERVVPSEPIPSFSLPYVRAFDANARDASAPKSGERRLARGTRLLSDDGTVVGLIRSTSDLPDCGGDRVAVPTFWGPLILGVDETAVTSSAGG
jgi:hypothetical protein